MTDDTAGQRTGDEARILAENIVDTVREPLLVLHSDLRVKSANSSFYDTFRVGRAETEGRLVYELGNGQWDIPRLRTLLDRILPKQRTVQDYAVEHEFERIGRRIMLLNAQQIDHLQLILLAIEDVTERKRAEAERELLLAEMSHRVKNLLALVQALALQTDGGRTVEEFREAFLGRLQALARAHGLLFETRWLSTDLKALVEQAVEAYRGDRPEAVEGEGGSVVLTARQGLALGLVLHELGTNAAKYGALARPEGRVRVSWRVEEDEEGRRRVRLRWEERHGPAVARPRRAGFGTRLIERACAYELDGRAELDFAPDGLRCEVVFPLA